MKRFFLFLFLLGTINLFAQKFEKLALTPPMGWNSWNTFACNINEQLIKDIADSMVSNGMKDAGYVYINIDDCWHGKRDSLGFIHANAEHFPSGIKALADYIHSKGLKIGIYSDAGWETCGHRPGSRGREYQDAQTYASWNIDYLKYDWCATEGLCAEGAYLTMRDALYEAGRPIVFSICEWGNSEPWKWGAEVGHLWRTTGDIYPCFDCLINKGTWTAWGIMQIVDQRGDLRQYAGPGHWNDPDMMEVGNGMSVNEDRAHFSLWCMLDAPLIAGNDIRNMSKETHDILTNKEAIAINQDSLGIQAFSYSMKDSVEIWVKPLMNDEWAVCFLNRGKAEQKINFNWDSMKINDEFAKSSADLEKTEYKIRNVWTKTDDGTTKKRLKATLPGHDVILLRLTK